MVQAGTVLKFPVGKTEERALEQAEPKGDTYSYDDTLSLYQIATSVKNKGTDLVNFVDENRQLARQAGIEMLAVQISAIMEGQKFQRVMDALDSAIRRRTPVSLSQDGTDKVHRLEKLIADADHAIIGLMNGRKVDHDLGQITPAKPAPVVTPIPIYSERASSDLSTWLPVVIIGLAGVVGVIAIIAIARSRNP